MTSAITREDVKAAVWQSGIRDHRKVDALMLVIDKYAYSLRTLPEPELLPEPSELDGARLYKCKECNERKPLTAFPDERRLDPLHPYDCINCGGRDRLTYLCPECDQRKPAAEFPESKRLNPRVRALCLWCDQRTLTGKDFDRAANRKR